MVKIIDNFITEEEEKEILSHITPSRVSIGTQRNRIVRYGSKVPYQAPVMGKIPFWLQDYCIRLRTLDYIPELPDSVTINEYHPTQSIDWHIDSPTSGPVIAVLSLLSPATMGLKKDTEMKYLLKPRSLLLLTGEERWDYKHCIYPVEQNRFSIVFRKGTQTDK